MKNILTNDFASELFDLSEDSIYNAKKPLSPEGILDIELDTQYTEEKYMAVLFFNHNMYKSNILTFTNANPPVDDKIADQADACRIEHVISQESFEAIKKYYQNNKD